MWITWFVAIVSAALSMRGAHSNVGLTTTSFSNELRSGFARLFQNGVEQPLQQSPFLLLNPAEFQPGTSQLVQRPAPFSPLASTGYQLPRPRYELQHLSWVIPYYYVPTRYLPPKGGKRPNDVLVIVVKTGSNCTVPAANGTAPADGDDADDGADDDGPNPDDDVEEVTIITGGTEKGKEPSRCVWAILSCCAPSNTPIRYTCFDVLGCSTAFWDTNPCVPAIIKTALDQATQYYGTTMSTNRTTTPMPTPPAVPAAASTDNVVSLMTGTSTAAASPADQTTPAATTAA